MKLFLITILIASGEGLSGSSKAQPKQGGSSTDLASTTSGDLLLEKVAANENLILKSVAELKSFLNKIELSLVDTHKELLITRKNTEVILSKYFRNTCSGLKSTEELVASTVPLILSAPSSPATSRKVSKETLSQSSVITILLPEVSKLVKVRCETSPTGSEWTVVLSRSSGQVAFNRSYADYEEGFGDPSTEYYIGNEALHYLTSWKPFQLRVELEDFQGRAGWAAYKQFKIGPAKSFYPLSIGGFDPESSTGKEDGFKAHNEMKFSTYDKDNSGKNCPVNFGGGGGWWYSTCYNVLGTGTYRNKEGNTYGGISYWPWHDIKKSLKKFKLLIRPL